VKRLFCALFACAAMLVGCGDDDSDFAARPDGKDSSSSVKPNSSNSTPKSSGSSEDSEAPVDPCKTEGVDDCVYGTVTDDRDGQTYKTVKIGNQTWMAENLNFETDDSYCYNDSAEYCGKYGRLYLWKTAMDSVGIWSTNGKGCGYSADCSPKYPVRGICPKGWHLPTKDEFDTLLVAVGGQFTASPMLRSTSGWIDDEGTNYSGSDAYGFSALPAGLKVIDRYESEGCIADFWASNVGYGNNVYILGMECGYDFASVRVIYNCIGLSVRCLKD